MKYVALITSCVVFVILMVVAGYYLRTSVVENPTWHFNLPNASQVPDDYSWQRVVAAGVAMLIGIVVSFYYRRFSDLQTQGAVTVNIGVELRSIFAATSFYVSLCAAPLVFCVVIAAAKGATPLTALILAFQNGFFWQTVMPKGPTAQPQHPAPVG